MQTTKDVSDFYSTYHDQIHAKRHQSKFWLRRYAHKGILDGFVARIPPGAEVLDAGCGEGILALMLAEKGARVVGADLSGPNVEGAKALAKQMGVEARFVQADVCKLPFEDGSFDYVVSSHVLEHLPDVEAGAREIARVTRRWALIAMPTCLNPASMALLGKTNYWQLSWRSPFGIPYGMARTFGAWLRGDEGPNEGYAGRQDLPHIWRFPGKMKEHLEAAGLRVVDWEAGPLLIPYLPEYIPAFRRVQKSLDKFKSKPVLRFLGYGTLAICEKRVKP